MVDWLRLIGLCLLAGAMVMVLRQLQPQTAGLLCVAFSVLLMGMLLPQLAQYVGSVQAFLDALGLPSRYYQLLLRAMGVALVTQLTVQALEDMDAASIARRARFCGRLAMLGIAVPVFIELTQMAVDALQ